MLTQLRTAISMLLILTGLTGGVYPLVVTGIAQGVFPHQANGSLMTIANQEVGSELIGQSFTAPQYFWGRLSATSPLPYNALASSGSNYGPLHPNLRSAVEMRIASLTADGTPAIQIPVDLVTASGSGLDPHISPAAAEYQVTRVAKARGLADDVVRRLVTLHTRGRQFGILGEPRVDVFQLNLALDQRRTRE